MDVRVLNQASYERTLLDHDRFNHTLPSGGTVTLTDVPVTFTKFYEDLSSNNYLAVFSNFSEVDSHDKIEGNEVETEITEVELSGVELEGVEPVEETVEVIEEVVEPVVEEVVELSLDEKLAALSAQQLKSILSEFGVNSSARKHEVLVSAVKELNDDTKVLELIEKL